MKVKRSIVVAASLLVMMTASACKREATGQVVAVVNGEEITVQELNAAMTNLKVPPKADTQEIRNKVLKDLIDQRLVAMAARADGLDKDQEYLLRQRQMDNGLLAQMLAQRAERTFRIPDTAAVNKYMAAHPMMFGERVIYNLDRIQFPAPADLSRIKPLEADHSMEAVATTLKSLGIAFTRNTAVSDSALMPPEFLARIKKLPPTEPFVVAQQDSIVVAVITGSTPAPLPNDQARPLVVQLMRRDAVRDALAQRLKSEQAKAKIEYQPSYGAPKAAAQPTKS